MSEPMLCVENLSVKFGGLVALDKVSFSVEPRQIHGVIGPNGAGKSTLFNAISGLVPSSGDVRLAGEEITALPAHARPRLGVMRTFQSLQLVDSMTVLENILVGRVWGNSRNATAADASRKFLVGEKESLEEAHEIAGLLGLGGLMYKTVDLLTFKEQRFVEIGRALISRPKLIMLDEPAAGLAGPEIDELRDLLLQLQQRKGFAMLLVEHVMSLVKQVCRTVTVLEYGAVIADGAAQEVLSDPRVIKAYLGEEGYA